MAEGEPILNARDCELSGFDLDAIKEAHRTLPPYDHYLLDHGGEIVTADSIRARLSRQAQEAVDERMREWFQTELEQDGI